MVFCEYAKGISSVKVAYEPMLDIYKVTEYLKGREAFSFSYSVDKFREYQSSLRNIGYKRVDRWDRE